MAITLGDTDALELTLDASNRQIVTVDGTEPARMEWLEITWASAAQSAANLVHVETGSALTDGAARGAGTTVVRDVHPGSGYRAVVYVGQRTVALSGSSAFGVSIVAIR